MSIAKIMIVEDEKIIAADLRQSVEKMGYAVCATASSGEDAVSMSGELLPDVILMDIVLKKGDMNGMIAAEHIKHLHIPVIFLTACDDEAILHQARITASYGYIIKPFEDSELHSAIEIALYKSHEQARMKIVEQYIFSILNCINKIVIDSDHEGRVTFMNDVAENLTGWKNGTAIGKMLTDILDLKDEKLSDFDKHWLKKLIHQSLLPNAKTVSNSD